MLPELSGQWSVVSPSSLRTPAWTDMCIPNACHDHHHPDVLMVSSFIWSISTSRERLHAGRVIQAAIVQEFNPCHARPPYGRTYPLGPGILWVYPPNQKDFIDFYYCFNNVLNKLKLRNMVKGKTLILSIIQYPLNDLCSFYFAKCKGTQRPDISGVGHAGKIYSTGYIRC